MPSQRQQTHSFPDLTMTENTDGDIDWNDLEEEHRKETERTDRAHEAGRTFEDVVREQYERLDNPECGLGPTISAHDRDMAALLAALDEGGELERVLESIREAGGLSDSRVSKSQLIVASLKYSIGKVDEGLLEDANAAYVSRQDTPF